MKKLYNNYKKYLIAPLITIGIVLIIYAIKGIYPFGKLTIANGDMGQAYMTFYYFLYDVCHGTKSIFYDYTLGMGSNMYGGFMMDGLLNPSAYIILLNTRDNIPYMFSFILMIKFAFIALTSYILFKKINKNNEFYNYLFSVLYALSAYSLMYNTNLMWLDVVALFPLFIIATKYMFDTNKVSWFAIVLSLMLIFNYNLAYMVLMFIIFIIPIYIHFGIEKENRKKATFNLIIGVLLSIGLSAFSFIPSLIQVMSSYRMSGVVKNATTNVNILYKLVVFYFYSISLYLYINWIANYKKDKNHLKMNILALVFSAIIPILFERVNLWWHTGSYQLFPFRYGFIPIMILFIGSLRYANMIKESSKKEKINKVLLVITSILFIPLIYISILCAKYINSNNPAFDFDIKAFIYVSIIFALSYIMHLLISRINYKKYKYVYIGILNIILILTYSYSYIGVYPANRGGVEWSDEGVFYANKINNKLDENLYRLKDLSASTYENSPLVSNIPSMSTFLHIISKEQVLNTQQLGYSSNKTKLHDFGGTMFTDAIYGIKYIISNEELPERLYNFVDNIDNNKLYEYKNILPYGILYEEEISNIPEEYYAFTANNYLYQKLFNKEDNIIEIEKHHVKKEETILQYDITVTGEKEIYLYINDAIMSNIYINNKSLNIPIENNHHNTIYPTSYRNGILDLGYYKDEKISIMMTLYPFIEQPNEYDIEIGILDINKYESIFKNDNHNIDISINKNNIKVTGSVDKDTNILLPITYDEGFKGNTEIKRVYNTFIGIPLKKGNNDIELTFKPKTYTTCVYVTLLTIALMLICHYIGLKHNIRNIKFIMYTFWILGIVIYSAFIIKFYIISIIETFISFFK